MTFSILQHLLYTTFISNSKGSEKKKEEIKKPALAFPEQILNRNKIWKSFAGLRVKLAS